MVYHWSDHGCYNNMVFDRDQIRPAGKIDLKNAYQYWNRLWWSNIGELGMFDHLTNCGLSNRMVVDGGQIRPAGEMHFKNAYQY